MFWLSLCLQGGREEWVRMIGRASGLTHPQLPTPTLVFYRAFQRFHLDWQRWGTERGKRNECRRSSFLFQQCSAVRPSVLSPMMPVTDLVLPQHGRPLTFPWPLPYPRGERKGKCVTLCGSAARSR